MEDGQGELQQLRKLVDVAKEVKTSKRNADAHAATVTKLSSRLKAGAHLPGSLVALCIFTLAISKETMLSPKQFDSSQPFRSKHT